MGREDFDFSEIGKVVVLHDPFIDFGKVGAAFSHDTSIEEEIRGFGFETANVISGEPVVFGAASEFCFEVVLPPGVVDVEGDTKERGVELLAKVVRYFHGRNGASVATVDGVKRLDEEFDSFPGGVGKDGGDPVTDLLSICEGGLAWSGTANKDERFGSKLSGFVDEFAVLGNGFSTVVLSFSGEETASNIRNWL